MNPIKTTNAMNPAPAKGIESFPTPVIDDVVISEVVNAWKGNYEKLEYGTLWKNVSHAPNQGSFPEHKLVYQQPTSEDGQWVKRIWVNDRVNQDSYNYAIKYSAGSQEHPIYIRTYIVQREGYAPLPDGTPDPLFPTALLVDEEATRAEGELDSKYIKVTRVYETLPGPAVPTKRYNERGDLETVIVQTVPPNTPPDPDGLLVTGSQVVQEEMGKGVKTTSTVTDHTLLQIKEKKSGLLGETITTDDIVDPSTNPDVLSQSIVSSTVEQYTATKARKRTTTSTGPTSLTEKTKDGKLLGDVTSTESIVSPSTDPDAVSSAILQSQVKQIDSGKAIKTNVVLNSTPTLSGGNNSEGLLGIKTTTESIVAAGTSADALSQSVLSSIVEPIDSVRSKKTTISSSGPTTLSGGQKKEGLLGETTISQSIVAAGTSPDTLTQTVVSSEVTPIDSAKSKKTTITAIGPTSLIQRSKDGKLLGDITATETVVAPETIPDSVSSTILSSEVRQIDSGKAVKKNTVLNSTPTLLGGSNGEGLLGTKTTNETIVPAGSSADTVSLTVISSQVEPIDSIRSKKTTITSTGPTSLPVKSLVDSPLGLINADVTKEIVTQATIPSTDPYTNAFILKDSISSIDAAKSERETVEVMTWPTNTSVVGDEQIDISIFYSETIEMPSQYARWGSGSNSYDIKAIDQWKGLSRRVDQEKFDNAIRSKWYKMPSQVDIKLPDILKNIKVYWGGSYGIGRNYDFGGGAFTGSYNRNQSGSGKSSYSINGDIYFDVQSGFSGSIPGFTHIFFMKDFKNLGDIVARLNDFEAGTNETNPIVYSDWPYLQLTKENLVLIGGSKSRTDSSSLSESVSINGFSSVQGGGKSIDSDVNVNSITIPESLHYSITISEEVIGDQPFQQGNELFVPYGVRPLVIPESKAILNGVQVNCPRFPTGNYLISATTELYKYGWAKVTAKTANITSIYTST